MGFTMGQPCLMTGVTLRVAVWTGLTHVALPSFCLHSSLGQCIHHAGHAEGRSPDQCYWQLGQLLCPLITTAMHTAVHVVDAN